jgi:hypothetical protein
VRGEELRVAGTEAVGPYTLLRVEAGSIDPGIPGQFFMLHPPGTYCHDRCRCASRRQMSWGF